MMQRNHLPAGLQSLLKKPQGVGRAFSWRIISTAGMCWRSGPTIMHWPGTWVTTSGQTL